MSPEVIDLEGRTLPGLVALVLFGVLSAVYMTAEFAQPAGFPSDASVVANIGYAMFNLQGQLDIPSEGFLVAFILIAVVLDAALDGSIMLAKREKAGEAVTALADGGQVLGIGDDDSEDDTTAEGGED